MKPWSGTVKIRINLLDLMPFCLFLASLLLIFFVIPPQFNNFKKLHSEKVGVDQEFQKVKDQNAKLRGFASSSSLMKTNLEILTRALPNEAFVPTLMNQIQQIANEAGVVLVSLNYGGRSEALEGGLGLVSVQAGVNGDFEEVLKFLELVENASRILNATNVNFGIDGDTGKAFLSLPLESYFLSVPPVQDPTLPITLELTNTGLTSLISRVSALKYYDTPVDLKVGVGKIDPFKDETFPLPPLIQEEASVSRGE